MRNTKKSPLKCLNAKFFLIITNFQNNEKKEERGLHEEDENISQGCYLIILEKTKTDRFSRQPQLFGCKSFSETGTKTLHSKKHRQQVS